MRAMRPHAIFTRSIMANAQTKRNPHARLWRSRPYISPESQLGANVGITAAHQIHAHVLYPTVPSLPLLSAAPKFYPVH